VDFVSLPFPTAWQLAAFALIIPGLLWSAWTAPWKRFEAGALAHVWYGTTLCVIGVWSARVSLQSGITFHLLGVSLFALLTGPRPAFVGAALAVGIVTALRDGSWGNYGLNVLVLTLVPIVVTAGVLRAIERWLPPNPFVYIFVGAFFGPALAMLAAATVASAFASIAGALPKAIVLDQFLPWSIYLAFAEATITGMLITLLAVYRPEWVMTYDERRYLRGR
jgi:uncharacterized membrane protein